MKYKLKLLKLVANQDARYYKATELLAEYLESDDYYARYRVGDALNDLSSTNHDPKYIAPLIATSNVDNTIIYYTGAESDYTYFWLWLTAGMTPNNVVDVYNVYTCNNRCDGGRKYTLDTHSYYAVLIRIEECEKGGGK